MLNALKKMLKPELPTVMAEAERELKDAELEFLRVSTKVDYYISLVECHASRIRRLRETLKTHNVLASPDCEDDSLGQAKLH